MIKNKIKSTILLAITTFVMVSCGKDYLEKELKGGRFVDGKGVVPTITSEEIKNVAKFNPDLQASNVSGLYSMMYTPGTGGTTRHDDFGQRGYDIYSDMLSADMAHQSISYNWYTNLSHLKSTEDYTDLANYMVWRYYYRIIQGSNSVIEVLELDGQTPSDELNKHLLGQAKAMRGYAYFYLLNFFVKEYNPSEKVLPIYKDTKSPNQPKSSARDVVDLVISDLKDAIVLLETFSRQSKDQVNKYVAEGLLAYMYAYIGDYSNVVPLTEDIISNGGFPLTTANDVTYYDGNPSTYVGFNNINTPGWMWGTDLTTETNLDLVSWWGQCDLFTFSYQWAGNTKVIDQILYDKISPKDVRKKQFYRDPASSRDYFPTSKFFSADREVGGQKTITADYVYMRVAEMYLLKAEALAQLGSESEAKMTLKQLLKNRFKNLSDINYVDSLTGQALKDEIYLQTRIELWGEGKSYLAMKRNKATVTRGNNHFYLSGESFRYNDPKLTFVIPQSEIQNNPNIN